MSATRRPLTKSQRAMLQRIRWSSRGPLHETAIVVDPEGFKVLSDLQGENMAVIKERLEELEDGARYCVWLTPLGWARGA